MKKTLSIICIAAVAIMLCGCEKRDSLTAGGDFSSENVESVQLPSDDENIGSFELMKLSTLKKELLTQIETVKKTEFPNITVTDDFTATVPNVDRMYNLTLTIKNLSFEEKYAKFNAIFDDAFAGIYSASDKDSLIHVSSADKNLGDYLSESSLIKNHLDELKNGNIGFSELYVDAPEGYLSMLGVGGGINGLNLGGVIKRAQPEKSHNSVAMTFATKYFDVKSNYLDIQSADTYALLDKEISVKDAARTVKEMISDKGYSWGGALTSEVCQVKVLDIGDEKFGYSFTMTPAYKGVTFDAYEMLSDDVMSTYSKKFDHNYKLYPMNVFMMESDKIDQLCGGRGEYDVRENAEYESVIPLNIAVKILSDCFSEEIKFSLSRADLLYAKYSLDEQDNSEENLASVPVWKFRCHNSVDNLKYVVYVNAVDGNVSYYTCDWWEI
ncbi:MAG: hypothetical protein ACI4DP_11230 [Candidatus Ornithomonoglobus sp.]